MDLKKFFRLVISIPKTIYFNFRVLPFNQAIKLPVFIAYDVELGSLDGVICIEMQTFRPFIIKYCLGGSEGVIARKGYFSCGKESKIIFKGRASFGAGTSIRVDCGKIVFGNNFSANKNCFFSCSKKICFGSEVLMGFNISVRDSDGHSVYYNDQKKANLADIKIGDCVWIASNVDILKGTIIENGSIVAYRSCVVGGCFQENCLIGGYPAKILRRNVYWKK